ncbi:MAG TPA: FAD-binding protein, partial [Spongiibacteraceae bacterium]|nr:FAD-binding protein [Spongiibacteraceae bacterium]
LSPPPELLPIGWRALMDGYSWSADNAVEIEQGWIKRANTIAELADILSLDKDVLEDTVARYNAACRAGSDSMFNRLPGTLDPLSEPPYYAMSSPPLLGWTNGGPRRDGRGRVLDPYRKPIKGLYAAGSVSSTYSWGKDGGFHIADALAFGRVAGREAASNT